MTINSRQKGAQGEREVAKLFRDKGWDREARRGQQFAGGTDSPDVLLPNIEGLHLEVKRVEKLNLYDAMDQAIRDAGDKMDNGGMPAVMYRKNGREWLTIILSEDMEKFATIFCAHGLIDLEWLDRYANAE